MNEDLALMEVMLELCEEENTELRDEVVYQSAMIRYLEYKNKELYLMNKNLLDINKRLN
tara:strand:- start:746 stop:922 length:177 start_codon:yes stop_codon:yes gene_type:complete